MRKGRRVRKVLGRLRRIVTFLTIQVNECTKLCLGLIRSSLLWSEINFRNRVLVEPGSILSGLVLVLVGGVWKSSLITKLSVQTAEKTKILCSVILVDKIKSLAKLKRASSIFFFVKLTFCAGLSEKRAIHTLFTNS